MNNYSWKSLPHRYIYFVYQPLPKGKDKLLTAQQLLTPIQLIHLKINDLIYLACWALITWITYRRLLLQDTEPRGSPVLHSPQSALRSWISLADLRTIKMLCLDMRWISLDIMLPVLYIRITLSASIHTLYTQLGQKELSAVPHDVLIAEGRFGLQGG